LEKVSEKSARNLHGFAKPLFFMHKNGHFHKTSAICRIFINPM